MTNDPNADPNREREEKEEEAEIEEEELEHERREDDQALSDLGPSGEEEEDRQPHAVDPDDSFTKDDQW
ncbi:MAG: hypothetical protein OER86_03690 [Phycisphaerae bacterium]|nr:hypothetical protein [Phycisphaerae bacterium]